MFLVMPKKKQETNFKDQPYFYMHTKKLSLS